MHKRCRSFGFLAAQLASHPYAIEPPLPALAAQSQSQETFDGSVFEKNFGYWVSPGGLDLHGLGDVEQDLARLQDRGVIDWCSERGRPCFTTLIVATQNLLLRRAELAASADTIVFSLHRALRLLEVLLPRMSPELLPLLLTRSSSISRQLANHIFSFRPGAAGQEMMKSSRLKTNEKLSLALPIVGAEFGKAAQAMLNSVAQHTRCRLQVFVIGDVHGWTSYSTVAAKMSNLESRFVDTRASSRFSAIWHRLSHSCVDFANGNALSSWQNLELVRARLALLFLSDLLPNVKNVISLDVGDLLVLRDIRHLWATFEWFNHDQLFAAAWEVGPTQINHDAATGDALASKFWRRKGLPRISKGLNTGVVLFNLDRLRTRLLNGTATWTDAIIELANRWSHRWCELEIFREQVMLSSLVFTFGDQLLYELSSRWNYIPTVPWEHAFHDANATGTPRSLLPWKLFPGLQAGGRLAHPCPGYAELLAEWTLTHHHETVEERAWWLHKAREYFTWFTYFGAPGFYTSDVKCGSEIWIVHFAGYMKHLPWARRLIKFWAESSANSSGA